MSGFSKTKKNIKLEFIFHRDRDFVDELKRLNEWKIEKGALISCINDFRIFCDLKM